VLIPLVPKLMQRFDTRTSPSPADDLRYSCFMNTAMSPDYAATALDSEHRSRHRPGHGADAADLGDDGDIAPQDAAAASGISNMLRNLAARSAPRCSPRDHQARTVSLQHHRQSVTLGREEVRNRIAQMTDFFMAMAYPTRRSASAASSRSQQRQAPALVMGFSDTFAVIAGVLVLAPSRSC